MDALKPVVSSAAAVGIGILAWRVNPSFIPFSVAVPAIVFAQNNRRAAATVAFSYYAAASWTVIEVSSAYFAGGTASGILPWLSASVLLTAPWAVIWSRTGIVGRLPLALFGTTVPPVGLIDWASPMNSAGVFFPDLGFVGVAATVALMVVLAQRQSAAIVGLALLSLYSHAFRTTPRAPADWIGFDTKFGIVHDPRNPMAEFRAAEAVQHDVANSRGKVLVFPESVVPRWTEATDSFWRTTLDNAGQRGAVLLIGAGLPVPGSTSGLRNVVAIRGATNGDFEQRIPVPLAMWKPWGKDRVSLNLGGTPVMPIAGERVAIFICYEQLLPWSYLTAAAHQPTMLVGVANASWTKHTPVPQYQSAVLHSWARLFGKPVISATNY
jgi:hypothetical protein